MSKVDFLKKWREDYTFRAEMRARGIEVIQDNVIFFNPDGTLKAIAGAYVKQVPEKKKIFKKTIDN